jgi:hypothetical protein
MKNIALVLAGALVGGLIGYFAFIWIAKQGLYALVLPGGLLGIGAGLFRNRSIWLAVVCGILALALGLYTEWRFAPFLADNSLHYFLTHVHKLEPITLLMIGLGTLVGCWGPFSRYKAESSSGARSPHPEQNKN